ncbi:MAG: hypothetical protein QUS33_04080 [Dehalococcoidia bacterium]|nr:hypothetical protein [Dehalococcoidia bacterium]
MLNKDEAILADPFLDECDGDTGLPGDAVFGCAYGLNIGVDILPEAVFFRRTETTDELWILEDSDLELTKEIVRKTGPEREHLVRTRQLDAGCAFAVLRKGEQSAACEGLLGRLFFSRAGHYWPEDFQLGGIIDEATYYRVKREVKREIEENMRRDMGRKTEIIALAEELGLSPRPAVTNPGYWDARCPGKGHPLLIKADVNEFFCGYCGRKGGMEELRALVRQEEAALRRRRYPGTACEGDPARRADRSV